MKKEPTEYSVEQFILKDDGTFPNSHLPALLYKGVLKLPRLLAPLYIKRLFKKNGWSNSWNYGIFEYNHYHSITHEVLGVHKGETTMLLGGPKGVKVKIEKGDVLIIPAGVSHKNLGRRDQVQCIGAYPAGCDYDIYYGNVGERPQADRNIRKVPIPDQDPVFGKKAGLIKYW